MRTTENPRHVERANDFTRRIFDWMVNDRYNMMKSLDVQQWQDIDLDLAWETFDPIAYKIVFEHCMADSSELTDPLINDNIWQDIMVEWPETYYMELYVKAGIAYKFEEDGEIVYGLKERHSEELSRLLTASSTKDPS
jgi:hypothetical protein